jgi:threonine dehydratase
MHARSCGFDYPFLVMRSDARVQLPARRQRPAILRGVAQLLVPLARIVEAREALIGHVHRTPILSSAAAADVIREAGGPDLGDRRIYVKAEHLQKTGSFKPRGMFTKVASLSDDQRQAGIITVSAGNAGQAYAWAGREAGAHTVVVMPEAAVQTKVEACLGYGAEVVLHGSHVGDTFERMRQLSEERGLVYCPPFDDQEVIAGHGSLGLEIVEDLPEVDVVVVGIGGGGLISGVATAIKETHPDARVYGVEPEGSNAMSVALERGEIVPISPVSVADGLGAPFAGEWTLAAVRQYVDEVVLIDDATILAGLRFAAERTKQVLEPAGAAALAAVLFGRIPLRDGDRVCVIASGGTVALDLLGSLLERGRPVPGVPVPT